MPQSPVLSTWYRGRNLKVTFSASTEELFRKWSTPSEPIDADTLLAEKPKCQRITSFDEETADTEEDEETASDHENDGFA